jgi:hypothetical protein
MASLEGGVYEFRQQAGYDLPPGLSNFPTWFTPIGAVRPADLDFFLQSNKWDAAIAGEFKPEGYGALPYAQSCNIQWISKINERCYGLYIEDPDYKKRSNDHLDMTETYKVVVYRNGIAKTHFITLQELYDGIVTWWNTGKLVLRVPV